jgi:protein-disulfide isomerase
MVRCAGEQGKYWEMRDRLFANPQAIAQTASHAAAVGLDAKSFEACLDSGKFAADIRKDIAQAEAAGVQGTPSFFLAVRFFTGAQPFANFKMQIDAVLAEQGAPAEPGGPPKGPAGK